MSAFGSRLSPWAAMVAGASVPERLVTAAALLLTALALCGPWLAPASIYGADIRHALQAPSAAHLLGTDELGRDVFWRIVAGARATLLSATLIVFCYGAIGSIIAILAATGPRWRDEALMRMTDIGLALPGLVVALGLAAVLPPNLGSAILALVLTGWPITARMLRGLLRHTMEQPYVLGARVLGVSRARLILRHVLPNVLDLMLVKWVADIGNTILALGTLSFIGVGAQSPSAEWGASIASAGAYLSSAWWVVAAPGSAIAATVLVFGLLGDMLQARLALERPGSGP